MLLDLIYLMGLLEEEGWLGAHPPPRRKYSEEILKEDEKPSCPDEGISKDGRWLSEDERKKAKDQKIETEQFPSASLPHNTSKTSHLQESTCLTQPPQTSQSSKSDALALEMRAVRVSYLLTGGLKTLTVIFTCDKLSDLLLVPKPDPPLPSTSPLSSPTPDQVKASGKQWDENAELRSVLQYVVQSMVKWAVRPCPIKQTVTLADLERAQVMIYKGALNRLQDDKERKGIKITFNTL